MIIIASHAPKLWPAVPFRFTWIVSSGRPLAPCFRVTSPLVMVPTTRWTLRTGSSATTFSPRSMAGLQMSMSVVTCLAWGYLLYTGLIPDGPPAIMVAERLTGRELGAVGREIVASTVDHGILRGGS